MSVQATSNVPFANELMLQVFSYLEPKDLGSCAKTCKEWKTLAYDDFLWGIFEKRIQSILSLFPSLTVINEQVWKNHIDLDAFGLDVEDPMVGEDSGLFNKRTTLIPMLIAIRAIREMTPLVEENLVGENSGVTLLTIPKGLSYNKLREMSRTPLVVFHPNQPPVQLDHEQIPSLNENRYSTEFGDVLVNKTYRVVISNSILNGSYALDLVRQNALLERHGFDMPEVLQVATLAILNYKVTAARTVYPSTSKFTRCREIDDEALYQDRRMSVGWNQRNLFVGHKKSYFGDGFSGVGAVKKLL